MAPATLALARFSFEERRHTVRPMSADSANIRKCMMMRQYVDAFDANAQPVSAGGYVTGRLLERT
jgi:hypothetical protein